MRIVVIDPRRTATCDIADLHLPVKPGEDVRLFNGLLADLASHGAGFDDYIRPTHTRGFDARRGACAPWRKDNAPSHWLANDRTGFRWIWS
jgi:assimilatory nitrate reductase catalytic subunit